MPQRALLLGMWLMFGCDKSDDTDTRRGTSSGDSADGDQDSNGGNDTGSDNDSDPDDSSGGGDPAADGGNDSGPGVDDDQNEDADADGDNESENDSDSSDGDGGANSDAGGDDNCQPSCAPLQCGDDGCGGSCGSCPSNSSYALTCTDAGLCKCQDTCEPSCTDKACGDDGCGGSCGNCAASQACSYDRDSNPPWQCQSFTSTSAQMSFFVTSTGNGNDGGNLGGLAGADAKCQALAAAVGLGSKTWRAYLSAGSTAAKNRIGTGPWRDARGQTIVPGCTSSCVDELHANGIVSEQMLTELGTQIDWANAHDILTGSNEAGDPDPNGDDCQDWTSNSENDYAAVGHSNADAAHGGTGGAWNFTHNTSCDRVGLQCTASQSHLYCFAL